MIYLRHFSFPHIEQEYDFSFRLQKTCYDTLYPFFVVSKRGLRMLDFEPVTILYGGEDHGIEGHCGEVGASKGQPL